MKKSSILIVPLVALTLLVAFTPATRAAIDGSAKAAASLMHDDDDDDDDDDDYKHKKHRPMFPKRFCGDHCHHHSHLWWDGWYTFWCGGHN
jgi:hypothetical protein